VTNDDNGNIGQTDKGRVSLSNRGVYDRGNHHEFLLLTLELSPAGILSGDASFDFDFVSTEKSHESYNGVNVRLRYFLRFTIIRGLSTNITKEQDMWVINFISPPEVNSSIKMEVGIEECLHIEFEYGRSKYHLKDVILGKVYFFVGENKNQVYGNRAR